MPAPTLPRDQNFHQIQGALTPAPGLSQQANFTGASVKLTNVFDPGTLVVEITAEVAGYIKFGDNAVVAAATDHYIPAGIPRFYSIADQDKQVFQNVAFFGAANGKIHVSELK